MQSNILDVVRRRFARHMDTDQLAWLLAVQSVREYFRDDTIEWSLRHGVLKIHTDNHDVVMRLFAERDHIQNLIYQKWSKYELPWGKIKRIMTK